MRPRGRRNRIWMRAQSVQLILEGEDAVGIPEGYDVDFPGGGG